MAELRTKCYSCTVRTFDRPFLGSKNAYKDFNDSHGLCSKVDMLEQHLELQESLEHSEQHTFTFQLTAA